jgi:hypothetical protein
MCRWWRRRGMRGEAPGVVDVAGVDEGGALLPDAGGHIRVAVFERGDDDAGGHVEVLTAVEVVELATAADLDGSMTRQMESWGIRDWIRRHHLPPLQPTSAIASLRFLTSVVAAEARREPVVKLEQK